MRFLCSFFFSLSLPTRISRDPEDSYKDCAWARCAVSNRDFSVVKRGILAHGAPKVLRTPGFMTSQCIRYYRIPRHDDHFRSPFHDSRMTLLSGLAFELRVCQFYSDLLDPSLRMGAFWVIGTDQPQACGLSSPD